MLLFKLFFSYRLFSFCDFYGE